MNTFINQLKKFFEPLSAAQKLLFGLLTTGVIAVLITLFVWAAQPDYALLFGSLSSKSAQTIVEDLKSQGVKYQLKEGGTAIYVPSSQVYDLRLKFASSGVVDGGSYKGYELFDSNTLGMTDFMQRVNLKRALEGELGRTISILDQVESARVHLVLPERSPFTRSNVEATASVILNITPGKRLSNDQIEGIASLVAGSVEDLNIDRVTILDQKGAKISNNDPMDSDVALSSAQMKVRQQAESYLLAKGQSMLDQVLGAGNAIIRVSTEHDFEKLSRDSNLIDPESRIVISEEIRNERLEDRRRDVLPSNPMDPPAVRNHTIERSENTQEGGTRVRNYEVNTTRERYEKPIGGITRISASILVNNKKTVLKDVSGLDSIIYTPYNAAELREISGVVRTALGIREDRGDELTITQIRFDDTFERQSLQQQRLYLQQLTTEQMVRWGLILLALAAALGMYFAMNRKSRKGSVPLFFNMKEELNQGERGNQKALPRDDENYDEDSDKDYDKSLEEDLEFAKFEDIPDMYRRKLSPEAQRRLKLKSKMFDEIKNFAEFKSDDATGLVRSFMVKDR